MSAEVTEHSLVSICLLVVDCPHATPKWTDSGVVVLRNQNIKGGRLDLSTPSFTDEEHYEGRTKRATPTAGDIVITREAPMGDVCLIPEGLRCCLGQRQVLLRPDPQKVDARFLLFALQSPYIQFQIGWNEGTGSTVSNLRIPVLESLKIPTPSMSLQVEIATTLGALDDRIALLCETNATLEAIAQALFKSWFVDFDPVRAKMEGRAPEGMDEATAALFPDALEESELGWVPKGWRVGTLADVATLNAQSLLARNPPPEINYIDLAGVKANVFDVPQCYSFADAPSRARRVLHEGDCIVGTVRPGNRSFGFIATAQNHLTGSTGFAVLSPKQCWMTAFTYLCATRDESIDRLAALADGGAYPAVRPEVVASTPCALPTDEVMKAFDSISRQLLKAIGGNSEQAQTLATLRDTLLPRLISGQLRLPEAQALVAAA